MTFKTRYAQLLSPPNQWGDTAVWYRKDQRWNTQVKPYKGIPQAFYSETSIVDIDKDPNDSRHGVDGASLTTHLWANTYNKAYSKMKDRLGEQSQWANNFLEMGKTVDTVVTRATQLLKAVRNIRRGQFFWAAQDLGLRSVPKGVPRFRPVKPVKDFGNLWLEYHFGWEPLVKDIGAAIETLTHFDPGTQVIRANATIRDEYNYYYQWSPTGWQRQKILWVQHALIGCSVRFSNPNLGIAQQLGFVNPLSVVWEAVPFSFVVDWFVNVGDVLGACTDFAGCEITRPFVTSHFTSVNDDTVSSGKHFRARLYLTSRSVGSIPGPILHVKPFKGFSPVRGLTAISLLVKGLRSGS